MAATKKAKSTTKVCVCANLIDNKLRDYNTRLTRQFVLNQSERQIATSIVIATDKVDLSKRGKAKTVLPTYCPFCGTKYASLSERAMTDAEAIAVVKSGGRAVTDQTKHAARLEGWLNCHHIWRTVACDNDTDVDECALCGQQRLTKCNFDEEFA